jgi:hypothetical protein
MVEKVPEREPYVSTVKLSPFCGVKPLMSLVFRKPSSVAVPPTASLSYWLMGVRPPSSMLSAPVEP